MLRNIVGRKKELEILQEAVSSPTAELIAIYGRRRVGKTFLVKEFFDGKFDFYATGVYEGRQTDELKAFTDALRSQNNPNQPVITDWMEAFRALRDFLSKKRKKKIIVFLDELPWFDIPPGSFLKAFEWFWNSWGSTCQKLKMIVCGSATTWMTDKFISSKGGLFNRTTRRIHLTPFNLYETGKLLKHDNFKWSDKLVLDTYMVFGGIPYYIRMLDKSLSLDSNIDNLFFKENALLKNEYEFILKSLFRNPEYYIRIIDALSTKNRGLTKQEIIKSAKITDNGGLTRALKNLISCDFIRKYNSFGKKEKGAIYQLTDLFLLFHKRFVEDYNGKDDSYWRNMIDNPKRRTWSGIAFEQVALLHLRQIKESLGISGVLTESCAWSYSGDEFTPGCQIDLLISRRDKVINVCEMKYSTTSFSISKKYAQELSQKLSTFREISDTNDALHLSLVTPYGLKTSPYSYLVNQIITLKDLMKP